MKHVSPYLISSIAEQHRILNLPKPLHPLISVFRMEDSMHQAPELAQPFSLNFYCVALKRGFKGKFKYGRSYYDFDEGALSFLAPHQLLANLSEEDYTLSGISVSFHADLIRHYPLAQKIDDYGFFGYTVNEALHLSDEEEQFIERIMNDIDAEYRRPIDQFSQDVVVAHLELLLTYSNRFYTRQFLTRKAASIDLIDRMQNLLTGYFQAATGVDQGLPTVEYLAGQLNLSPGYLSDMLRTHTGQTAQQHIHDRLIDQARTYLAQTELSVAEIAYQLGFERPQSFNKLFKNKTSTTPLAYRKSFQ